MMIPEELKELQVKLSIALKAEKEANELVEKAQAIYDAKLADFKVEHAEIIEALEGAKEQKLVYKKAAAKFKATATSELGIQFIDDLPEGFVQKKKVSVAYNKRDMRRAALLHFHHLLVLDEKAVVKFIKDNATQSKSNPDLVVVSENIRDLVIVDAYNIPLPNISNATLLKLDN